ncbi:cyclin-domain-containing protein, partial [Phlyctochytrium arcticum]
MSLPSPSLSQEPTQEQQYKFDLLNTPVLETVRLVSSYLGRITAASDSIPDRQHLTRFHARTIPSIDVLGYTSRILKYAPCGNECFLAALIYFERMGEPSQRLSAADSEPLIVDSYNVHRLLIAGIMVAVKFLSDVFFTNLHMSRVGGLPVHELNQLEVEFLLLNDFNLSVSVEELQYCGDRLLEEMNGMKSTVKMDRMVRDVEAITVN